MKQFPKNFLWGASTSAFQVEGGYGEGGRGIANSDMCSIPKGQADFKTASDHFHHFKEDVALMKELSARIAFRIASMPSCHVSYVLLSFSTSFISDE